MIFFKSLAGGIVATTLAWVVLIYIAMRRLEHLSREHGGGKMELYAPFSTDCCDSHARIRHRLVSHGPMVFKLNPFYQVYYCQYLRADRRPRLSGRT